MTVRIRKAQGTDISQLSELARAGYKSSPVFSFTRIKAEKYPKDTVRSYHEEFKLALANPRALFLVVEVDGDDLEKHTPKAFQSVKVQASRRLGFNGFAFCNRRAQNSGPMIIGFSIWRLSPNSEEIHETIFGSLKYIWVSLSVKLTSIFWKPRDIDQVRADKVKEACDEALRAFDFDSMELEQMVVHPDFWRRRYGTALGEYGLCIARKECRSVGVIATPMGEKLYESMGFLSVGKVEAVDREARCSLTVLIWREGTGKKDS